MIPELRVLISLDAFPQQTRARKQHQRNRYLQDDERVLQAAVLGGPRAAPTFFEEFRELTARRLPSGQDTEHEDGGE
jgi:hypothetical protein